jgi:hypothetical protein
MKKKSYALLIIFCCFIVVNSCQKGISWDFPSEGELEKDIEDNCAPVTASGNYVADKEVSDSNYLIVSLQITVPGTYTVYSDTVNGFYFKGTGEVESAGTTKVKLACGGKPLLADTSYLTIFYNNSQCQATIVVNGDALETDSAQFSFQNNQNNCLADTVYGTYFKNVPLDTSSTVSVSVNVLLPGYFKIFTNTVNGYSFAASGQFASTGIQTVKLTASGTPMNEGTDQFDLQPGSGVCTFNVTVLGSTVPVTNNDYFPLAANNYWVYDDLWNRGDSVVRRVTGTSIENGNTYYEIDEQNVNSNPQYLFRKDGNDYFEYGRIDRYTNSVQYADEIDTTLLFLNQDLQAGVSWESVEIAAKANFGQLIYLKYLYRCLQTNAIVTINGKAFSNVYIISMMPEIKSEFAGYGSTSEVYTYYYAKGIGLIYMKCSRQNFTVSEMQIRRWNVN